MRTADGTGSVYCPVLGFGITAVETLGSATSYLVCLFVIWLLSLFLLRSTNVDLSEAHGADRTWIELAQDYVESRVLLNLWFQLPGR